MIRLLRFDSEVSSLGNVPEVEGKYGGAAEAQRRQIRGKAVSAVIARIAEHGDAEEWCENTPDQVLGWGRCAAHFLAPRIT